MSSHIGILGRGTNNASLLGLLQQGQQPVGVPGGTGGRLSAPGAIAPKAAPQEDSLGRQLLRGFKVGTDLQTSRRQQELEAQRLKQTLEISKEKRAQEEAELAQRREVQTLKQQEFDTGQTTAASDIAARIGVLGQLQDSGEIPKELDIGLLARDEDTFNTIMGNKIFPKAPTDASPVRVIDPTTGDPIFVSKKEAVTNRMRPAPRAPLVAGGPPKQTKLEEGRDEQALKFENKIFDAADASVESDNESDQLEAAFEGTYTGLGGELFLQAQKAAQLLGIEVDANKIGRKEAGEALSKQMALRLRNPETGAGLPGQMSDADRDFLKAMVPGIGNSAEGRRLMVNAMRKVNQRNREVADMARQYLETNDRLDSNFRSQVIKFAQENPLFTEEDYSAQDAAGQVKESDAIADDAIGGTTIPSLEALQKLKRK